MAGVIPVAACFVLRAYGIHEAQVCRYRLDLPAPEIRGADLQTVP
jgi:hypothetical protein